MDYYLIKRGNIHVPSLFDPQPGSLYYYTRGWNLKALVCWVCAATFGIPGLIGSYHPNAVGAAATHIYQMGWVITFASATAFYFGANQALPAKLNPDGYSAGDMPVGYESYAATDGYLGDDSLVTFPPANASTFEGVVSGSGDSAASKDGAEKV